MTVKLVSEELLSNEWPWIITLKVFDDGFQTKCMKLHDNYVSGPQTIFVTTVRRDNGVEIYKWDGTSDTMLIDLVTVLVEYDLRSACPQFEEVFFTLPPGSDDLSLEDVQYLSNNPNTIFYCSPTFYVSDRPFLNNYINNRIKRPKLK